MDGEILQENDTDKPGHRNMSCNTEPIKCPCCGSRCYVQAFAHANCFRTFPSQGTPRHETCESDTSSQEPLFSSPPIFQPIFHNRLVPQNVFCSNLTTSQSNLNFAENPTAADGGADRIQLHPTFLMFCNGDSRPPRDGEETSEAPKTQMPFSPFCCGNTAVWPCGQFLVPVISYMVSWNTHCPTAPPSTAVPTNIAVKDTDDNLDLDLEPGSSVEDPKTFRVADGSQGAPNVVNLKESANSEKAEKFVKMENLDSSEHERPDGKSHEEVYPSLTEDWDQHGTGKTVWKARTELKESVTSFVSTGSLEFLYDNAHVSDKSKFMSRITDVDTVDKKPSDILEEILRETESAEDENEPSYGKMNCYSSGTLTTVIKHPMDRSTDSQQVAGKENKLWSTAEDVATEVAESKVSNADETPEFIQAKADDSKTKAEQPPRLVFSNRTKPAKLPVSSKPKNLKSDEPFRKPSITFSSVNTVSRRKIIGNKCSTPETVVETNETALKNAKTRTAIVPNRGSDPSRTRSGSVQSKDELTNKKDSGRLSKVRSTTPVEKDRKLMVKVKK